MRASPSSRYMTVRREIRHETLDGFSLLPLYDGSS